MSGWNDLFHRGERPPGMITASATRNRAIAERIVEECVNPPSPADLARFTASPRVLGIFTAFANAFPDAHFTVEWMTADESRVVTGGRVAATHRGDWRGVAATGRAVDFMTVVTVEVDRDAVIDMRVVSDSLAIAEQIGAVEGLGPKACELLRPAAASSR
jgi:hypothetical protein